MKSPQAIKKIPAWAKGGLTGIAVLIIYLIYIGTKNADASIWQVVGIGVFMFIPAIVVGVVIGAIIGYVLKKKK